jgi:glycosyltransferase involved in cell wall biosynthesis
MGRADDLPRGTLKALTDLGRADILVGIPSYNNARTIGHVVQAAHAGLVKYFPGARTLIVNADGGSTDGTPQIVIELNMPRGELLLVPQSPSPVHRFTVPYNGIPGKGSAFRCIFEVADRLHVKACAVVDADLRSISPEWMQLLLTPVVEGRYDYVAPYYLRHKYDGTITNNIIYPMTRALYGQRVRQPIGGDFGLSGRVASHFLRQPVWGSDVARYGVDIWMTTTAMCGRFRVCQVYLGSKLHDAKDPGADLAGMLVQVLGTLFSLMEAHEDAWMAVSGSRETPLLGFRFAVGVEPIGVDVGRMIQHFRNGVENLGEVWGPVLNRNDLRTLKDLAARDLQEFRVDDALWVRMVYDVAAAYHHRQIGRTQLIRSALPLYMGRVASFVREVADQDAEGVEHRLEELCGEFERAKPYLVERWQSAHGIDRGT